MSQGRSTTSSFLLLVYGLLAPRYPVIGIGLVGLGAATSVVPEITSWSDERFALVSLLISGFVVFATARVAAGPPDWTDPDDSLQVDRVGTAAR
ncbi:MAG TPA: hypothetical protein VMT79_01200 [Candidatus Binatia bacterium]|nr:hypothetical protein [Candidatus Binatia bacterium]